MIKKTKEVYCVSDWDVEVNYTNKQIKVIHSNYGFFLDYYKEENNCEIKEFRDFLSIVLNKFQGMEKPVETERVECKE